MKSKEITAVSLHFRGRLFDKNGKCASIAITNDTHDAPLVTKLSCSPCFMQEDPLNGVDWENITMAELACDGGKINKFWSLNIFES